jgi:hypothetical protein
MKRAALLLRKNPGRVPSNSHDEFRRAKPAFTHALVAIILAVAAQAQAGETFPDATTIRRFALVASSNDGGPSRTRLRFANSDGESIGRVLANLGGVREGDLIMVGDATRASLTQAFADLKKRIAHEARPQLRREVFVYYSGHSDEEGLLLSGERVSYRELRQWIDGAGAEVRIAILDSCASGSLIRLKGGVHRAPFLSDVSTQARGHAFLTASSADEAAQESDRVGAAFFTHYLLSGMRGAADANHDRRVTLNEAYQFAYNETLQRTETSRAGAQHPAYDIQLAGTGDLVMTDLHTSASRLVLARDLAGRIYVRDNAGRLVVELRKEPTYPVELGLEAGKYHVVLDHDGSILEGDFNLQTGGRIEVAFADLAPVAPLVSVRRGDEPAQAAPAPSPVIDPTLTATAGPPRHYRWVGFDLVLAPGFRMSGNTGEPVEHGFLLGIVGDSDRVRGVQLSAAGNIARDGVNGAQIGSAFALSYGPVRGAQVTGGYNLALGGLRGIQIAWIASVAVGPVRGAQISMINVANGRMRGVQVGLANIEKDDLDGAQIGVVNVDNPTHQSRGVQVGLANITSGEGEHAAASVGLVNVARKQKGVQVGLVNIAEEMDGVQLGLVSLARKNSGASFALLPIVLDGDNRLTLGWNSTSAANLGFKLGTRRFYVAASFGITRDTEQDASRYYACSFGLGGHLIPRDDRFFLDLDLVSTSFATFSNARQANRSLNSARLQAGFAIARHLAVVAGPTLNVQVAEGNDDRRPRNVAFAEQVWTTGNTTVRMYPGFTAGLEF